MYLDDQGNAERARSRRGYLASGVPGTVHGLLTALDEHGTLDRATVMAPAIRLARNGFRLTYLQAQNLNESADAFAAFESTQRYFTKADGSPYRPGERFVQTDLARTLERIRNRGIQEFYTGRTADLIVEEMERGGGLIGHDDLRRYTSVEREPVSTDYRGYTVHGMGPPSSGGVAIAQLLHAAERKDIGAMGHNSSATVHYLGEASSPIARSTLATPITSTCPPTASSARATCATGWRRSTRRASRRRTRWARARWQWQASRWRRRTTRWPTAAEWP